MPIRVISLAACSLLLAAFALLAWTAQLDKCATFDEPLHFLGAWVQTHYDDFRVNPEDPPLWKFYLAAGTDKSALKMDRHTDLWNLMLDNLPAPALHYAVRTMYQTPGNQPDWLLRAGRARMLLVAVLLGVTIAWWAWRLGGPFAAVVATAAFSLDPNFLAHSPLIKNDVAITLVLVLVMATVWLLGERATLLRCAALFLLVGVALTTKFSGLLALPMIAIALTGRALIPKPWPFLKWTLQTRLSRSSAAAAVLLSCALLGYVLVWACYGFRFSPSPDSGQRFDYALLLQYCAENEMIVSQDPPPIYPTNTQLREWVNQWKPDLTASAVQFADRHKLFPQAWLFGFLFTYASSLARRCFLSGNIGIGGWWYYFPLAMVFKTPLATLAGFGLAGMVLTRRRSAAVRDWWPIAATLVAPIFYIAVAMRSHLDIGLRHIFPVYPFLFVFLGVTAAAAFRRRPKITGWIVSLLFLGLLAETVAAYPDYIPFFNVAAGGSRGGLALLGDSNIDWGQDLPALADWQRDHPDRQLYLCRLGLPDPRYYHLHYIQMTGSQMPAPDQTIPSGLSPIYAISAAALQGPYMPLRQRQFYQRFLQEKPEAILHGTIYLFDKVPD
ncbi:MAG: hypothetical protein ABSB74_16190 [Tepidisphaeraceae bacterium]